MSTTSPASTAMTVAIRLTRRIFMSGLEQAQEVRALDDNADDDQHDNGDACQVLRRKAGQMARLAADVGGAGKHILPDERIVGSSEQHCLARAVVAAPYDKGVRPATWADSGS